jgi:hypothetical protein
MGETQGPTTRGQRDHRSSETQALREAALFAVVFGGLVLINAVLGLFLIEVFGSLEARPTGNPDAGALMPGRPGLRLTTTA